MKRKTKEELKQKFARLYNKVRVYKRTARPNMNKYFYCPKFLNYYKMSKVEMAIYPVLCIHANFEFDKPFRLPIEFITRESGLSNTSAIKGLSKLGNDKYKIEFGKKTIPFLVQNFKTEGERHFYEYNAGFIRKDMVKYFKGDYFIFHEAIIKSGVWANLSLKAKALYLAMRHEAKFDLENYTNIEGEYTGPRDFDFKEEYVDRLWDVCDVSLVKLCQLAGINYDGMPKCIEELEHVGLLLRLEDGSFIVYLKPSIMMRY